MKQNIKHVKNVLESLQEEELLLEIYTIDYLQK